MTAEIVPNKGLLMLDFIVLHNDRAYYFDRIGTFIKVVIT